MAPFLLLFGIGELLTPLPAVFASLEPRVYSCDIFQIGLDDFAIHVAERHG